MLFIGNFKGALSMEGKIVSFVNPYSFYVLVRMGFDFSKIDVWFSDGFLFCRVMSLFGYKIKRYSFDYTSIAAEVFDWCAASGKVVAVVGSDELSVSAFSSYVTERHGINLAYSRNGFFNNGEEYASLLNHLLNLSPDVLVVGMGAPLQERLLVDLKALGWTGTGFTCGGFIHQTKSASGNYYPDWIDRYGLRFAYRMYREPNTVRRYFFTYPKAICFFVSGVFSGKIKGNSF